VTGREPTNLGDWSPLSPRQAARAMATFVGPWWIAGGCAIELFIGREIRAHGDIDIEVLRRDQSALRNALSGGWDLWIASGGHLSPWEDGANIPDEANDVWCRNDPAGPWRFEVVLAASDGDRWLYRRDPSVSRPLTEIGFGTTDGIPCLRPEMVLLFKAKDTRHKDEQDFEAAVPLMDEAARMWLRQALVQAHPGHPWIVRL